MGAQLFSLTLMGFAIFIALMLIAWALARIAGALERPRS